MSRLPVPFLLARRILKDKGNRFSRPIIRLSVMGVSIGVVIMMLAIGITSGYKQAIRDKVIAMGSHIRITHFDQNYSYEQVPFDKNQPFVQQIRQHSEVADIQHYATKVGVIKTTDQVEGVVLKGLDPTFHAELFRKNLVDGELLQLDDTAASRQIVISKQMSDKLKLHVGDKVQTYFVQDPPRARSFTVAGIYHTGLPEYDNMFALVDIRQVQRLNDWDENQISGMEVLIKDYNKLEEMGDYIHHHINPDLKAETIRQIYPDIFEWIALFDTNVAVLLIITTCVCIVTMLSIFFIVVLEQTRTIGLLKTMGLKTKTLVQTFVLVACNILLKGMLIGDAVAITFGLLQQRFHFIKLNPETYYVDFIPVHFHVGAVCLLNAGVFVLCAAVLLLPAWVVARKITPTAAVRWE